MSFISLMTSKLHKKLKKSSQLVTQVICRDLASNVASTVSSNFYGRTTNDTYKHPENVQKCYLATSN